MCLYMHVSMWCNACNESNLKMKKGVRVKQNTVCALIIHTNVAIEIV